jgi:TfoX/Sxy family transcriptional regulator of competence genes
MPYDRGLADRVRSILAQRSGLSERHMFGGIAFMIDGHMCCGVVKTDLMLRLAPESVARGLQQPHTRPMDFTGKPMKSMLYVDAIGTDSDEALQRWVEAALTFVLTLPPKKPAVSVTAKSRSGNRT